MAADSLNVQKDRFVTEMRTDFAAMLEAYDNLVAKQAEFNARGWSGDIDTDDLSANNYDITPQDFSDALGSVSAITTLMSSGHLTNVSKMVKR